MRWFDGPLIFDEKLTNAKGLFSAETKGSRMKYVKRSSCEFSSFEYVRATPENIKRASEVHYLEDLTICDILASESVRSCSRIDHISSFKVSYVGFIMPGSEKSILSGSFQSQPQHKSYGRGFQWCQKAFQL